MTTHMGSEIGTSYCNTVKFDDQFARVDNQGVLVVDSRQPRQPTTIFSSLHGQKRVVGCKKVKSQSRPNRVEIYCQISTRFRNSYYCTEGAGEGETTAARPRELVACSCSSAQGSRCRW